MKKTAKVIFRGRSELAAGTRQTYFDLDAHTALDNATKAACMRAGKAEKAAETRRLLLDAVAICLPNGRDVLWKEATFAVNEVLVAWGQDETNRHAIARALRALIRARKK
jgi:hypothetical protein